MSASGGPVSNGGGNAGIGTGNAASIGIGGESGPASTGEQTISTATGSKVFNFNAPASRFTDSFFGKAMAGVGLLFALILAAAWVKKNRKA